jgi:hypothetical protein
MDRVSKGCEGVWEEIVELSRRERKQSSVAVTIQSKKNR